MQVMKHTFYFKNNSEIELKNAIIVVTALYASLSNDELFLHHYVPNLERRMNVNSTCKFELGATTLALLTKEFENLLQIEEILISNNSSEDIDESSFALIAEDASILEVRSLLPVFLSTVIALMKSLKVECVMT